MNFSNNSDLYKKHLPEIQMAFNYSDILRGQIINERTIEYLKCEKVNIDGRQYKDHYFNVESESFYNETYGVVIRTSEMSKLSGASCDCYQFERTHSCKHIIACLKNYADVVFEEEFNLEDISKSILEKFTTNDTLNIKKEVFLELEVESILHNNYYGSYFLFDIKLKIGNDKMYNYKTHQRAFVNVYKTQEGICAFGKEFTYSPNTCFFSPKNEKLINYINRYFPNLNSRSFIDSNSFKELLDFLFENKIEFKLDNHLINEVITEFPFKTYIKEIEEDKYELSLETTEILSIGDLTDYIFTNGNVYKLDKNTKQLLHEMFSRKTEKLIIKKKDLNTFSKGILPIIKKSLTVDDKIKDKITIIDKPDTSLYFDLKKNEVSLEIKFDYGKEVIDYFDKNDDILRDMPYENEVINDVVKYGFNIEKNKLVMNDLESEVNLIEYGLGELANKYKIFTTENFKKVNLKKKTNISSTFSIGQDNILSYNFDMDGIDNKEIVNILKSIKEKKKYYRLKDGSIVNLDDENLNELNNLIEDMEFTDEEIINGKGSIQKYRAIYLDSVRNTKYHIVKTDNLFTNFVDNFYKFKDKNINLTKEDLSILRDYQITGVKWLYNLDKTGFGGILADEMGLGKTIQVIYYIKEILKENKNAKFLIVVPTSLVYNWEHEFNTFGSEIKIKLMVGNRLKRKELQDNINDTNVIITTYGLIREDEEYYIEQNYHGIILDEAQNIKNAFAGITRAVKNIKSDVKFALTGTPIENSALELWSIFDFIMPGYLSSYQRFNGKYKINNETEEANVLIEGLSNQINPFILRRKKTDVVKELPEKIENNIFIDLSDAQKKLYVTELNNVKKKMEETINEEGMSKARFLILQLLTKLRQICIDPKIVYDDYNGGSNKIDRLLTIIDESIKNGHKVLIFTSFRTALNIVKNKLEENDIESYVIDGSVDSKTRMERVDKFNNENGKVKVFLIMLKSGGTGLNLVGADVVIHLDLWWNPQAENQATDRAHRIGQKNIVEVIRLISKGTIEEKVLELQNKKKELSDKLIDGTRRDENIISTLSEEDIKNLLSYENKE